MECSLEIQPVERRRGRKFIASIGCVLAGYVLSIAPARAQDRPNGFFLLSPLELSSGYDSKFITGSRQLSDSVSIITAPTFSWIENTHRTELSVNYQPEVEIFAHNPDLNAWNNSAIFRVTHRVNSRWSLDAGDSFLDTTDSNRALLNSLLLLPRGRYLENTFYGSVGYRFDQATKLHVRFDNTIDNVDLTGSLAGRLNQSTSAVTFTVDRSLTRAQSVSGSYSFLHVSPLPSNILGNPTSVQLVSGVYDYEVNRGLLIRLAGGWVDASQKAVTGAVEVEKAFGNLWTAVGFQRYAAFFGGLAPVGGLPDTIPFASGVTPDSVYEVASFRMWGQLSKRIGVDAAAQKALNGVNNQGISVKSLIGRLRLNYRLTDRLAMFGEFNHYGQNFNRFSGEPLSENRLLGGIQITLSRPPEPENLRTRHGKSPQDSRQGLKELVDDSDEAKKPAEEN